MAMFTLETHAVIPTNGAYVPSAHATHAVAPITIEYVPAAHGVHAVAFAATEYVPYGQTRHWPKIEELQKVALNLPAAHAMHAGQSSVAESPLHAASDTFAIPAFDKSNDVFSVLSRSFDTCAISASVKALSHTKACATAQSLYSALRKPVLIPSAKLAWN